MQRRKFVVALPALALGTSGLLTHEDVNAFLPFPFLIRLLLGGVVRGTVTRTVTATVARTVVTRMVTTASLGLRASGILAVSSGVAIAYEKHRASEIWVAGRAQQALSISTEQGTAIKREQVYLGYRVIDAETGNIEKIGLKNVSLEPDKKITLSHLVKDLPYTGAKFVEGLATFDSKGLHPNDRFQFMEKKTVIVAGPSEVESS